MRCVAGSAAAGRHATLPGPRPRCPEHRNIVLGCSAARVSTLRQQQPPRHMTDGCCFPVSVCPIIFVILATVERKISLFLSAVNWGKFQLLSITLKILRLVKLPSVRPQGCIFGGFSFKAAKGYIEANTGQYPPLQDHLPAEDEVIKCCVCNGNDGNVDHVQCWPEICPG